MRKHGVEVAWPGADQLGEGPVWDDRRRLLYRVDPLAGAVLAVDVDAGAERHYATGRPVGCIVLREDDAGLLLGMRDGFGHLDLGDGTVRLLAPVGHDTTLMQLNDGGCDPAGRFYAGSISWDASPGAGVLYRYRPPDDVCALLSGIGVSNGMAWDSAGTTFYFVDSLERRVDRFRYEPADGTLADRRPAFDLSGFEGIPDGIEIDAEDCLWVAFWRGGAVRRFTGDGRLLDAVQLPVRRTTSCCLGGPRLSTLFITTARRSLRRAGEPEPLGGAIFAIGVDTPGVAARRWRAATERTPPRATQRRALDGPCVSAGT
jgi:sugar lactone lactonase YvrE